jgi:hypothetical protein
MKQAFFVFILALYQGESLMDLTIIQAVELSANNMELKRAKDIKVQLDSMPYLVPEHDYSGQFLGFKGYKP